MSITPKSCMVSVSIRESHPASLGAPKSVQLGPNQLRSPDKNVHSGANKVVFAPRTHV